MSLIDFDSEVIGVVVDTETTGIDPTITEMVEIAIVTYNKEFQPINSFQSYIRPEKPWAIEEKSLLTNGLKLEDMMRFPRSHIVKQLLINWLEDNVKKRTGILGHNVAFDISYLKPFISNDQYAKFFSYRNKDTSAVIRFLRDAEVISIESNGLSNICKGLGIEAEWHTALGDAQATLKLYKELIKIVRRFA